MNVQDRQGLMSLKRLKVWIATGFGSGYLPIGPGSWGTFPGMLLCWGLQPVLQYDPLAYLGIVLLLAWVGVHLASVAEESFGRKDPGEVVIDEMVAFPITMFLVPWSLGTLIVGFLLNRMMDTLKIWPCDPLQSLPKGWGIMMDDLVAGAYSCLLMHWTLLHWPGLVKWNWIF